MKSEVMTARISQLAEHPAQMRTLYQIEDMAALTLQVYSNDLDQWQPITATPDDKGGYYIISGHRRRMARLFAYGLSTWISQPDNPADPDEVDIELVKEFISTLVEKYEFVDAAAEVLTEHYATQEIEFVLFTGSPKDQILALQRANYGSVAPDMLGVAHSFQSALDAGATLAEIARNAGQSATYVRNHLALNKLPQELAEQIADGHLPMGTGIAVASVKNLARRHGLALFVLSNPPEQLTAKAVKEVAKKLDKWNGLQVPLTTAHQAQRNIARSLTRLWHLVVDAYPVRSWAVISSFIYQDVDIQAPWADASAADIWFKTIGGEHYYAEDGIKWDSVVANLIDEISCEACPVAKLPSRRLASDLSPGQSEVTGMPCRHGADGPCLHGLAPNDPFHVHVPWDWAEHEGVQKDASGYVVLSFDSLQTAWEAQAALEGSAETCGGEAGETIAIASCDVINEETKDAPSVAQKTSVSPSVAQEATGAPNVAQKAQDAPNVGQEATDSLSIAPDVTNAPSIAQMATDTPSLAQEVTDASSIVLDVINAPNLAQKVTDAPSVPLPTRGASAPQEHASAASIAQEESKAVKKMLQQIAAYMSQHTTMNVDHPFATPCAKCQHKRKASPTKEESVPHCAWANRWHEIHFRKLNPEIGKMVPVCRQFAPKDSWAQIIPAHQQKAIMPREWIKHQIQVIVTRSKKRTRHMCEFLTGRPMTIKAGEDWFASQFASSEPTLSDEQLWTLMVWVLAESERLRKSPMPKWQKPDSESFLIPADGKNSYFIKVSEIDFF